MANHLLSKRPHITARLSKRSPEIIVDEAQDTNVCRANDHLESVRGQVNYINFTGRTKRLVESAFFRDCRKDYNAAFDGVAEVLRELIWDDKTWEALDGAPDSSDAEKLRVTLWRFVKNQHGLPPVSLNGEVWITTMKDRLATLISDLGVSPVPSLGTTIQRRGLEIAS